MLIDVCTIWLWELIFNIDDDDEWWWMIVENDGRWSKDQHIWEYNKNDVSIW